MKRSFQEKNWRRSPKFRSLCRAFLACESEEDMANFLRDVMTLSEMLTLSERLATAELLAQGLPYREVSDRTGASTTTVTRVAWYLNNGEGGYPTVLKSQTHHHATASSAGSGRRR